MISNKKAKKFGKIGIAKANTVEVTMTGDYDEYVAKFSSLCTSLGVTFTGNAVNYNQTTVDIDNLEQDVLAIEGRLLIIEGEIDTLQQQAINDSTAIVDLQTRVTALE